MKMRTKIVLTIVTCTVIAMLANGNAPLGQLIWPPHEGGPAPVGIQLPLLMAASALEAVLFGLGVAFLAWGWPLFARAPAPRGLARAAHLSIVWLLVSWFPHDNLHVHFGEWMPALVALIWGFHVTLALAGAALAAFALANARAAHEPTPHSAGVAAEHAAVAGR